MLYGTWPTPFLFTHATQWQWGGKQDFYLWIILHLPTLQNLAPDVRGNGMYASWKLPYIFEGSRYEEGWEWCKRENGLFSDSSLKAICKGTINDRIEHHKNGLFSDSSLTVTWKATVNDRMACQMNGLFSDSSLEAICEGRINDRITWT